jgi:hypothetical protein
MKLKSQIRNPNLKSHPDDFNSGILGDFILRSLKMVDGTLKYI